MTVEAGALARPPFAGLTCLGTVPGPVPISDVPAHAEQTFVPMADSVRLATDVYLPRHAGRRPTILVRLPYDKGSDHAWVPEVAARLVDDGYAVVAQDVRGKARSQGATEAFVNEAADGATTLDWIEAQPWSDGRVGMWGQSYFGFTQWAAASTGHRALRCIVPQMTASDIAGEWMYRDGVFQLQTMAEWAAWVWVEPQMVVHHLDWMQLPVRSLIERWAGRPSTSYDAWMHHGRRARYWSSPYATTRWSPLLRASVLGAGGFWDVFARGQIRDFRNLRGRVPHLPVRLWMAARDHFGSEWTEPGVPSPDYETDPTLKEEALTRYLGPAPAWYHACFASERPDGEVSSVRFQVAGEGWRSSSTWPPPTARRARLHLEQGGALAWRGGRARSASIPYDPEDPVPSLDENPWQVLYRQADRSVLEHRGDLMRFQTEPLAEPLVLAGRVALAVTASARGGAGALHANLADVWPGGVAHRLASGVATVGRAPARVRVDLGDVCCRLKPGRALRLELACSDFPRHPRTDGDASALTTTSLHRGEVRLRLGADATLTFHLVDP